MAAAMPTGTPVFIEAEYTDPPCTGLETREADGTWLGATAFTHAARGNVVLWYGGETYEGLGGGYRWAGGAGRAPPGAAGPACGKPGTAPCLLDGDGDAVPTRWARQRGDGRARVSGDKGGETGPDPAAAAAAPKLSSRFLPFEDALVVTRSLKLASVFEWKAWCKEGMRPAYLPAGPDKTYKDGGWQGWVHWLGSGRIKKASKFAPFGQALAFAQSLNLASLKEWNAWCKEGMRPPNVPSQPDRAYKNGGWQGWGHWLGTGNQATQAKKARFLPFKEALAVARSLGRAKMSGHVEWQAWCRNGMRPPNMPSAPNRTYKDAGWQGWGHWLGTGNQKNQKKSVLPFDQALRVARSLRLVSQKEWRAWCQSGSRPANVPAAPDQVYVHDGWMGWTHWLYHANLGPATAPAAARPGSKRAAVSHAGKSGVKRGGKRQRR